MSHPVFAVRLSSQSVTALWPVYIGATRKRSRYSAVAGKPLWVPGYTPIRVAYVCLLPANMISFTQAEMQNTSQRRQKKIQATAMGHYHV